MIKTFSCPLTEQIWEGYRVKKLPDDIQKTARRKLRYLDAAEYINQLRCPPGNRLEALKGEFRTYYSIRINRQWRIMFQFEEGDAYEVQVIDYH